jgi:hypothetical protein
MVDALDHADELLGGNDTLVMNGAAAGRWLLEQPAVQEPVAIVSGYYGGQCVVLPTNPARLFNSGTAFYTAPEKGNTP